VTRLREPGRSPDEAPKLAIFDMGGVMVDGHDVAPAIASALGLDAPTFRRLLREAGSDDLDTGRVSASEFWARFRNLTGLELAGEPWGDHFHPVRRPRMFDLVERLKSAGVRVVAGTNTSGPHYRVHLDAGDYAVFDRVYASHLLGVAKPDPEFWLRILAAEGVAPEQALFIDDLPENVAAASGLGLTTVRCGDPDVAVAEVEDVFGLVHA